MRFLLDQGLPRTSVRHLRAKGFEAEHVGFLGLHRASDAEIMEVARQRQAIVATLDADFHALLALSGAVAPSVIRIRMERLKGEDVANVLASVAAIATPELESGAAVSVDGKRTRVRALPLKGRPVTP
jgi:predicted nuclease of predicted toxin-antitoxin system